LREVAVQTSVALAMFDIGFLDPEHREGHNCLQPKHNVKRHEVAASPQAVLVLKA
jgi:hypothetical protein